MGTIEVTDEQHAFIQRLREELSEQVVGKYGHVRERDAVQFLIDNFDGELEAEPELSLDDGTTADGGEAITYEEEDDPEPDEGDDDSASGSDDGGDDAADSADDDAVDSAGDGGADDGSDGSDDDADPEADGESAGDSADDGADGEGADGAAADDDMLDRMMNLLETHDDKWEESPAADYRYRVTLPDGSTEDVQTKDDVRALLFKNY